MEHFKIVFVMKNSKMKNSKLISAIRSVLINDWDPAGIGDNPNLSDEYDGYIGSILNILKQRLPIETIVVFLEKVETTKMGIDNVDVTHLYDVATKLKSIGDIQS